MGSVVADGEEAVVSQGSTLALLPVFNAGYKNFVEYEFVCGATLVDTAHIPDVLAILESCNELSRTQQSHLLLHRGYLRVEGRGKPGDRGGAEFYGGVHNAEHILRNVRFAIDLAGGGSAEELCGPYTHGRPIYSIPLRVNAPVHVGFQPHWYGPTFCSHHQPWTSDVLARADRIATSLLSGPLHPRLKVACQLRMTALEWTPRQWQARVALAVSALESFFIAPDERQYVWSRPIRDRVHAIVGGEIELGDDVFDRLKVLRDDVVHRGGYSRNAEFGKYPCCVISTPDAMLYRAIRWAAEHTDEALRAFDKGEWPSVK